MGGYVDGSQEDKGVDLYVLERALLSTHPGTEFMFQEILSTYQKQITDKKVRAEIIRKYEEIRMRGRKREILGGTNSVALFITFFQTGRVANVMYPFSRTRR